MSAQLIFDQAPLGAIVRYSDGTPQPPARHGKKLAAWQDRNNAGRLVRKQAERHLGNNTTIPASFTLHVGDYGGREVIVLRVFRSYQVDSDLTFTVDQRPAHGSVLVLDRPGDDAELVYVGTNRQDAEEWLQRHGYPNAVLSEVSADDVAADFVEGRAA